MKFLEKYWRSIVWLGLLAIVIFFFDPRQKQFYQAADFNHFAGKASIILVIIEAVFLMAVIPIIYRRTDSFKNFATFSGYFALHLLLFFLFFHSTFIDFGLYINRQTTGITSKKIFKVEYISYGNKDKDNLLLYHPGGIEFDLEGQLTNYVHYKRYKTGDTIQVPFTKGLFGVDYLNKTTQ